MRDETTHDYRKFNVAFLKNEITCTTWSHNGFIFVDGVFNHLGETYLFVKMFEFERATGGCDVSKEFIQYLEKIPQEFVGKAGTVAGGVLGVVVNLAFGTLKWFSNMLVAGLASAAISPIFAIGWLAMLGSIGIAIVKNIPVQAPYVLLGLGILAFYGYLSRDAKSEDIKKDLDKLVMDVAYNVTEFMDIRNSSIAVGLQDEIMSAPDQDTICVPMKRIRHVRDLTFVGETNQGLLLNIELSDINMLPDLPDDVVKDMESMFTQYCEKNNGIMLRPPLIAVSGNKVKARLMTDEGLILSLRMIANGFAYPPSPISVGYLEDEEEVREFQKKHAHDNMKGIWADQYNQWRKPRGLA